MRAGPRIAAFARRDATTQISYQFNLLMRFGQMGFWVLTLYFVGKLIDRPGGPERDGGGCSGSALTGSIVTAVPALGLGGWGAPTNGYQRRGPIARVLGAATAVSS